MKLAFLFFVSTMTLMAKAFAPVHFRQQGQVLARPRAFVSARMSESSSDSEAEVTVEQRLSETATQFIDSLTGRLGEGVEAPPEVEALKKARDNGADRSVLAARIYELMIEQGMLYDEDPDTGKLSPTQFDIKANLDVPEVKTEFARLYAYGMNLLPRGLLEVETLKTIVKDRLIARTGLTPEEFDSWLGY